MKDLQEKLLSIFRVEHAEHIEYIRNLVQLAIHTGAEHPEADVDEAFRRAHSLKGAARAVDLRTVESLAHVLESLMSSVREKTLPLDRDTARLIARTLDASEDCLASPDGAAECAGASALLRDVEAFLKTNTLHFPAVAELAGGNGSSVAAQAIGAQAVAAQVSSRAPQTLHVESANLERISRTAFQLLTHARALPRLDAELASLQNSIAALSEQWDRLPARLRVIPEYAAECALLAAEWSAIGDTIRSAHLASGNVRGKHRRLCWEAASQAEQLHADVANTRLIECGEIFQSLRKVVRDTAREQGKLVDFQFEGRSVKAERAILQTLKEPLLHMLNNAVTHGIESPEERAAGGKPEIGTITLRIEAPGPVLQVTVEDDGRGVDFERLRAVASERGLIPDEVHEENGEMLRLLLLPGVSTRGRVDRFSGRGMGMSVVRENLLKVHGDCTLAVREPGGLRVLLTAPLSIAAGNLLLVHCGGQVYAIPSHGIERLYRIDHSQIEQREDGSVAMLGERRFRLFSLARLLAGAEVSEPAVHGCVWVALLRTASGRAAVVVDDATQQVDQQIQDLGLGELDRRLAGGAVLEDGRVVLVLNPATVLESFTAPGSTSFRYEQRLKQRRAPVVLVVDDSITTCSLERNILEAHGYQVHVAEDGGRALEILQDVRPDIVITDIEMPSLDGFGLIQALKSNPELAGIPVIVLSSVGRPEDQRRGLELGAGACLVKRELDHRKLLETVERLL